MDNLTQTEIAKYLYDYSMLIQLTVSNPNKKTKDLFIEYLEYENRTEDANDEYYLKTIRIAYIFTILKAFSIGEDYTMKKNNNFIDGARVSLAFLKSKITNKALADKTLLQSIRNVFNHTKEGNELYKITKDCENITFSFLKPIPTQIQVDLPDFCNLINSIGDIAQTFSYFHFNEVGANTINEYINKLEIKRTCFLKKIEKKDMEKFFELENEGKHDSAKQFLLSNSDNITKDILLSKKQKILIANYISDALKNKIITEKELNKDIEGIVNIFLRKALPIPALKTDNYQLDSIMLNIALFTNLSYNELNSVTDEIVSSSNATKTEQDFYRVFKTYFNNKNEKTSYASLLYAEYIFNNFVPEEEEILIGDTIISSKKLRNSLVHSRWYINNDKIMFFDAKPRIDIETDYNWTCELKLTDLTNYCSSILTKKIEEEKNITFIKTKK